jgi:hypothetical protein
MKQLLSSPLAVFSLLVSTGALAGLNTTLPKTVGTLPGEGIVPPSGAAAYRIPLWTPPGAMGIEPHLALEYNSLAGDDLLGPGWRLTGLSAIFRCGRTMTQDGTPGPVQLSMNDKFCLDGNRLRLTSAAGTYGMNLSTYQTEIDTFSKVTANLTAGNGPQWFEVKGKDGLIYEYGNTTDSRTFSSGASTPYAWLLNKVRDRNGNNLTVTYSTVSGAWRPFSIRYTATSGSSTYPYMITFNYVARVTNLSKYVAGGNIQQTNVLSWIQITNGVSAIRTYNFAYETAQTTVRDRLTAIQECSPTVCFKETAVTYQSGTLGVASPAISSGSGATNGKVKSVDIDGDGKLDLVFATTSGANYRWWVQFAMASGYGAPIDTGLLAPSTANVLMDDFLGDGKIELLAPNGAVWYVYSWNGTAFAATSTGLAVPANLGAGQAGSADGDGDGLPDLWTVPAPTTGPFTVSVRRNTSAGGIVSFSSIVTASYSYNTDILPQLRGNNAFEGSAIKHVDFDGDGRDDVLLGFRVPPNPLPAIPIVLALEFSGSTISQGAGFANADLSTLRPLRWNDDACTDGLRTNQVAVSPCAGQTAINISLSGQPLLEIDWDGDGRTDVLYNSGGTWQLQRSLGTAAATAVSTGILVGTGTWVVTDQNGDGLSDLAFANASASNAISYGLHNGAGVIPDLAIQITDGLGVDTLFSYSPISGSGCYSRDAALPAFPLRDFRLPLYTACSMSRSDGLGSSYSMSYSYFNAAFHLQGRGFAGFDRVQTTDSRNGITQVNSYQQLFPYIAMPASAGSIIKQPQPSGATISQVSITTDRMDFGSGFDSRTFPYIKVSTRDAFEVGGALDTLPVSRETTTVNALDAYGNPTTVTQTIQDTSTASPYWNETYSVQTVKTITNDAGNWCLGIPSLITITSTLPDQTTQTRTTSVLNRAGFSGDCFV